MKTVYSLFIALVFASPQLVHSMDKEGEFFNSMDRPVKAMIFENASSTTKPGDLRLVCKEWQETIDGKTGTQGAGLLNNIYSWGERIIGPKVTKYAHIGPIWKRCIHAWYGAQGHEEDLEKFLNGRLIVKPYFENNDRMFEEKISNLKNPFAFKIPVCLENERLKYLGSEHRIRNLEENIDKIEIGFVPRFAVEKFINSCAEKPHRFMSQKATKCLTDKKLALTGLFYKAGNWDELKKKEYLLYEDVPAVYSDDMFHPLSFSRPKSYFDGRSPYFLGDGNLIPRQLTLVFDDSKEPSSTMCEDPVKLSHQIIAFGVGGLLMWIVEKYVFMPLNLISVSISPESL